MYSEFSGLPDSMPGGEHHQQRHGSGLGGGLGAVWVKVTAEDGTYGLGQAAFGEPVASFVNTVIAPILEGRNCLAIEHLNDLILRVSQRYGSAGTASTAMGGVDLALWDLKGKIIGQPVYALLGGPVRESITCYATGDDLDSPTPLTIQKAMPGSKR